jgi:hypothetical protein
LHKTAENLSAYVLEEYRSILMPKKTSVVARMEQQSQRALAMQQADEDLED